MGAYAEFIGLDQVVDLVQKRGTPYYQVYISKDLKFECIETSVEAAINMLMDQLEVPQMNGTTITYTIKFYKDLDSKGNIDKNTLSGTNTFKLQRFDQAPQNYFRAQQGLPPIVFNKNNPMPMQEITALDERMKKIEELLIQQALQKEQEEQEQEDEQEGGILGTIDKISQIVARPEVMQLIAMVGSIFKNGINQNNNSMGNVTAVAPQTEQEHVQRLNAALNTLIQYDANLVVHLEKLGQLAQKDPAQFNFLIGMLDKI